MSTHPYAHLTETPYDDGVGFTPDPAVAIRNPVLDRMADLLGTAIRQPYENAMLTPRRPGPNPDRQGAGQTYETAPAQLSLFGGLP